MGFHETWKFILYNLAGCPTMSLQITHLFDTMHIGKNVTETLWWLLELRREKDKIVKACKYIQKGNHAMKGVIQFHSNGDQVNINSIPWMFMKQQSNVVKEVIRKIKFSTRFCANLKNIIIIKMWFCEVQNAWLAHLHQGNYYCYVHIIFFHFIA